MGAVEDRVMAPGRRAVTIGLILTITMFAFEALGVATVMPVATDELGDLWLYGWVVSGFTLASIVGLSIAGPVADRRGPGLPYLVGLTLFAAGLVVGGGAPSMPVLVASRVLQGVGAGAVGSTAYASIARVYGEHGRARILAVLSTSWVVPGMVGPAIAGTLAEHVSWRWVFFAVLPFIAIAGVLTTPALLRLGAAGVASSDDEGGGRRLVSALQIAAGAALVLTGLGARHALVAAALVASGVLGLRALQRVLPVGTLRAAQGLPAAVATRGLLTFAFFGAQAFLPLVLTEIGGQRPSAAGVALTAGTLTWTAGAWVQERRGLAIGRGRLLVSGFALVALGLGVLLTVLLPGAPALLGGVVAWSVAGAGMGIAYSSGTLLTLTAAPVGAEGSTAAALQLTDVLGIALGAGVGGAAVAIGESADSLGAGLAVAFSACLAVAILGMGAARRAELPEPQPQPQRD